MAKIKLSNDVKIASESLDLNVCIDTSRVLLAATKIGSYTATEDCVVICQHTSRDLSDEIYIDSVHVSNAGDYDWYGPFLMKNGSTISGGSGRISYRAFGLK